MSFPSLLLLFSSYSLLSLFHCLFLSSCVFLFSLTLSPSLIYLSVQCLLASYVQLELLLDSAQLHWEYLRLVTVDGPKMIDDDTQQFHCNLSFSPTLSSRDTHNCVYLHCLLSPTLTCSYTPVLNTTVNIAFYFFHVQQWWSLRFYGPQPPFIISNQWARCTSLTL